MKATRNLRQTADSNNGRDEKSLPEQLTAAAATDLSELFREDLTDLEEIRKKARQK